MAIVTLICGGNQGNRYDLLSEAYTLLHQLGDILTKSNLYESEPWGFDSENFFLNQVLVISTPFNPYKVLTTTQAIEKKLGRKTKSIQGTYSDRPVDIDILFYDDQIISDDPVLMIPHPHISARKFVLKPLNEIAPDLIHPSSKKSIRQLLEECPDKMSVIPV